MKSLSGAAIAILFVIFTIAPSNAEPVLLEWQDLVPPGTTLTDADKIPEWEAQKEKRLSQMTPGEIEAEKKLPAPLVSKYNGKTVKIPGFMVPLDFEADAVNKFMLVPYVGACIHVPPPPGNQIILVESKKGVPVVDMNVPIYIEGKIKTGRFVNELASDIGYTMKLDKVSEYTYEE